MFQSLFDGQEEEAEAHGAEREALPRSYSRGEQQQQQQQRQQEEEERRVRELEEANRQLRHELTELGLDYKGVSVQLQAATRLAEELQAQNPDVSKAIADALAHERATQDIRNQKASHNLCL